MGEWVSGWVVSAVDAEGGEEGCRRDRRRGPLASARELDHREGAEETDDRTGAQVGRERHATENTRRERAEGCM